MAFQMVKWTRHITDSGKDEELREKPDDLNHYFRLRDDDSIVYGYGYTDDSSSFEPLDHYGPLYGVTEIQYKENGQWKTL